MTRLEQQRGSRPEASRGSQLALYTGKGLNKRGAGGHTCLPSLKEAPEQIRHS